MRRRVLMLALLALVVATEAHSWIAVRRRVVVRPPVAVGWYRPPVAYVPPPVPRYGYAPGYAYPPPYAYAPRYYGGYYGGGFRPAVVY